MLYQIVLFISFCNLCFKPKGKWPLFIDRRRCGRVWGRNNWVNTPSSGVSCCVGSKDPMITGSVCSKVLCSLYFFPWWITRQHKITQTGAVLHFILTQGFNLAVSTAPSADKCLLSFRLKHSKQPVQRHLFDIHCWKFPLLFGGHGDRIYHAELTNELILTVFGAHKWLILL